MQWYVLYTKPRWEQKVARELEEMGIETYCPLITEVKQWSDRKKKVRSPLFKSYVFVKLEDRERSRVFDVPGVLYYLYWLRKPAVVREIELDTIKSWLQDERMEEVEVSHLSTGDQLTIANGTFQGKEAIIQKVGKKRLRLILKSLDCVVNVKVRDALNK
ncbi:UpxY family transcription antiterminator [Salinimicrobium sp. GXAS 041]|uniref:UpxY family transcription antiterminator n=1 Tax=Salinimicrobium sp. GXAS 041 TaxID=3400806 RepID=UPI003C7489FF